VFQLFISAVVLQQVNSYGICFVGLFILLSHVEVVSLSLEVVGLLMQVSVELRVQITLRPVFFNATCIHKRVDSTTAFLPRIGCDTFIVKC
jgi:hypothetical protein